MKAMVLERPRTPLRQVELPTPTPSAAQVLVKVTACGVCRTDLHVVDGDLKDPKLPVIPGHEIVGHVSELGAGVTQFRIGERVGIPWLGHTCGTCRYCRTERENLCDAPGFTGYQLDGGYAEYAVADARYCFPISGAEPDAEVAPWLCAGLIGHRSLRLAGDAETVGIYGFGAAAHLVTQTARHQAAAYTRSRGRAIVRRRNLPRRSAAHGREGLMRRRPPSLMPRSSSRPSEISCLPRFGLCAKAEPWSSAAFT
jgi:propanol-preferring alcohol dehydrogenase